MKNNAIMIPMDVFDSPQEMLVIMPLGGVKKNSIKLTLTGLRLHISAERVCPEIKSALTPMQEQCFWGSFTKDIDLPSTCAFDRIITDLSPENILTIIIPKIITPEEIVVHMR